MAKLAARKKFQTEFKHWKNAVSGIDWQVEFPDFDWGNYNSKAKGLSAPEQLLMLLELNMAQLFVKFLGNSKLGLLPHMALTVLGNNLASSHVERMNSAAQLILHKGRTLLNDKLLNMLVVLRMNRKFMQYMRDNYPNLAIERFNMNLKSISSKHCAPNPHCLHNCNLWITIHH